MQFRRQTWVKPEECSGEEKVSGALKAKAMTEEYKVQSHVLRQKKGNNIYPEGVAVASCFKVRAH